MSRVNNTIDKFGRQKRPENQVVRGPPGVGFTLTENGHYNMMGKSIINVGAPENLQDAVNKEYVLSQIQEVGFTLTDKGHYNVMGKSIINVGSPKNLQDAVNKEYVHSQMQELRRQFEEMRNTFDELNAMGVEQRIKDFGKRIHRLELKHK